MTMSENKRPEPGCSERSDNPLKNWTREEKFVLSQALKAKGSHDIRGIKLYLPQKSIPEIKEAVAHYKAKAVASIRMDLRSKRAKQEILNSGACLPLGKWATLLVESMDFDELKTEIIAALRIIADMEDIPPAVMTENIDLRNAYHLLANAMEGNFLTNQKNISTLLRKCLIETAKTSKVFIRPTTLQQLVDAIAISENLIQAVFKTEGNNPEVSAIGDLSVQKNYNPLNIPVELMKPASR